MMRKAALFGTLAVLAFIVFIPWMAHASFEIVLTDRDKEIIIRGFQYKISVYIPRWNEEKKIYDTEKNVFYARHWELKESKMYSSIDQDLFNSGHFLKEKSYWLAMNHGIYFDNPHKEGEENQFRTYDYHLIGGSEYKVIIEDLERKRVVWRNYEWESF